VVAVSSLETIHDLLQLPQGLFKGLFLLHISLLTK